VLKIDDHPYSPTVVSRIVRMAGMAESAEAAALALQHAAEIEIAPRTVLKLATQVGSELSAERDKAAQAYDEQPLPRKPKEVSPPPQLGAVFLDGGRIRTRIDGGGHGVHGPHWRENKNAGFHRMQTTPCTSDPQPELPDCFCNQAYVEKLVLGLKKAKNPDPELMGREAQATAPRSEEAVEPTPEWQPKTLFRTCISSLADSDAFGLLMAAEADARGFFAAELRAYVGDGQAYNWTIWQRWFPTFTPIVDYVHIVEYLYEAAAALHADIARRWQQYVAWATACWQGRAGDVIAELDTHIDRGALAGEGIERLRKTRNYLDHNQQRMDYPRYRQAGLPVTSSLAESLVKQVNKRLKGTEKFWNDGPSGEAFLQVRAAILCHDERLDRWLRNRPVSPFHSRCKSPTLATSP
jgi:hypothetical protein